RNRHSLRSPPSYSTRQPSEEHVADLWTFANSRSDVTFSKLSISTRRLDIRLRRNLAARWQSARVHHSGLRIGGWAELVFHPLEKPARRRRAVEFLHATEVHDLRICRRCCCDSLLRSFRSHHIVSQVLNADVLRRQLRQPLHGIERLSSLQ